MKFIWIIMPFVHESKFTMQIPAFCSEVAKDPKPAAVIGFQSPIVAASGWLVPPTSFHSLRSPASRDLESALVLHKRNGQWLWPTGMIR